MTEAGKIHIDQIRAISENARTTWFALVGVLTFAAVTALGIEDQDFFAHGRETQLPLLGVSVPVRTFFWAAPILIVALTIYFHLYLLKLWWALRDAPAEHGGLPLNKVSYPWLLGDAALWLRRDLAPQPFGWMTLFVAFCVGWLAAPVILWLMLAKTFALHDETLGSFLVTLWAVTALSMGASLFVMRDMMVRRGEEPLPDDDLPTGVRLLLDPSFLTLIALVLCAVWYAGAKTDGPMIRSSKDKSSWFRLYRANLERVEIAPRPDGWIAWEKARAYFRADHRNRLGLTTESGDWTKRADRFFLLDRREKFTGPRKRNLFAADLRGARLVLAFAPYADFVWADLRMANLQAGNFEGAVFRQAKLDGADLDKAHFEGANFRGASLRGTSWEKTKLSGATFRRWEHSGLKAPIPTDLSGALFNKVDFRDADLTGAILTNVAIFSSDLRGVAGLTQAALNRMIGNAKTRLPDGLVVPSCFLPGTIDPDAIKSILWAYRRLWIDGTPTVDDFIARYGCSTERPLWWYG